MTAPFVPAHRHVGHDPIVPTRNGAPPAFVVACLDCGFATDAHARTEDDAVTTVAPTHHEGHHLIARTIDYARGWERPGRPLAGIAASSGAHPLYGP